METQQADFLRRMPSVQHRKDERTFDELVGICKGIIADKTIVTDEAKFLLQWLAHAESNIDHEPIYDVLTRRLTNMLADGTLHPEEESLLLDILKKFTGDPGAGYAAPSALPLNDPAPAVILRGRIFVFTGLSTFAPRGTLMKIVTDLGGVNKENVTKTTDYLVIGNVASEFWIHSTHGLKIKKAMDNRDRKGLKVAIISEDHWLNFALKPSED